MSGCRLPPMRSGIAAVAFLAGAAMSWAQPAPPARPVESEQAQDRFVPPRPHPGEVMKHWPAYPDEARAAGQEGTVFVRLRVTENGDPADVTVERSSSFPALDLAAALAVSLWKFDPATRGGQPVSTFVTVPIKFSLTDPPPAQEPAAAQ